MAHEEATHHEGKGKSKLGPGQSAALGKLAGVVASIPDQYAEEFADLVGGMVDLLKR